MMKYIKNVVRKFSFKRRFPSSVIGDYVNIDNNSTVGCHSVLFDNTVLISSSVGPYSYIQRGTIICNTAIGPYCSIAGFVNIGLASHPTHMISTSPVFYDNTQSLPKFLVDKPLFFDSLLETIIEADVWIGQGSMVKAGVRVGVGSVIGAGAIVTRDVAPYSVIAGIPGRVVKMRFPEDLVSDLVRSKWWEIDAEKLKEFSDLFSDPKEFLKAIHVSGN